MKTIKRSELIYMQDHDCYLNRTTGKILISPVNRCYLSTKIKKKYNIDVNYLSNCGLKLVNTNFYKAILEDENFKNYVIDQRVKDEEEYLMMRARYFVKIEKLLTPQNLKYVDMKNDDIIFDYDTYYLKRKSWELPKDGKLLLKGFKNNCYTEEDFIKWKNYLEKLEYDNKEEY